MVIHVFRCSSAPNVFAFTRDRIGSNLPPDRCGGGHWEYFKDMRNVARGQSLVGVDADMLLSDIGTQGYHLGDARIVTG